MMITERKHAEKVSSLATKAYTENTVDTKTPS